MYYVDPDLFYPNSRVRPGTWLDTSDMLYHKYFNKTSYFYPYLLCSLFGKPLLHFTGENFNLWKILHNHDLSKESLLLLILLIKGACFTICPSSLME